MHTVPGTPGHMIHHNPSQTSPKSLTRRSIIPFVNTIRRGPGRHEAGLLLAPTRPPAVMKALRRGQADAVEITLDGAWLGRAAMIFMCPEGIRLNGKKDLPAKVMIISRPGNLISLYSIRSLAPRGCDWMGYMRVYRIYYG